MLIQLTNEDTVSEDKNDSELSKLDFQLSEQAVSKIEELNIMFEKQKSLHGKRKILIRKLLETLREDGFKDHQIVDIVLDRVKGVSRSTIYAALPQEVKRQYTKPLPKTINVTTEHKVIDVTPEQKEKEIITAVYESQKEEEEPTPLELAEIKIKQLEDALKKTEQFKPASALEQLPEVVKSAVKRDEEVFSWLKAAADGIGAFYYDSYGIDLFRNRELAQLKNSGVKVFRRLYFEV